MRALRSAPSWPAAANAPPGRLAAIGRAATVALYDELALYPKPGMVSLVDNGSHRDMGAATYLRSLFALRHYFAQAAALGATAAPFTDLEQLGLAAEHRMLRATAGVNTHRGAIFSLGLLCAAAGRLAAHSAPATAPAPRRALLQAWGPALAARCARPGTASKGQIAARRDGLRSARQEAALGFPLLFEVTLPALRTALADGLWTRAGPGCRPCSGRWRCSTTPTWRIVAGATGWALHAVARPTSWPPAVPAGPTRWTMRCPSTAAS